MFEKFCSKVEKGVGKTGIVLGILGLIIGGPEALLALLVGGGLLVHQKHEQKVLKAKQTIMALGVFMQEDFELWVAPSR